jgi:hypothetical protein
LSRSIRIKGVFLFIELIQIWKRTARDVVSGAGYFIQAIVITWLVAGVAAGEVPEVPSVARTGLLIVCLYFYSAAAARVKELWSGSTFWLGMSRPGSEIEPLMMILKMLILVIAGISAGVVADDETVAAVGLGIAILLCLWILARSWPLFSVPFFFEGKYRWSPAGRGLVWSGPGLDLARKLCRLPGSGMKTFQFMITMIVVFGPLALARLYLGPGFLLSLLFYALSLPFICMLNFNLTEDLIEKSGIKEEYE